MNVCVSLPTLWSQDKLDRSILRVLEGDDGEETLLSGTTDTGIKTEDVPTASSAYMNQGLIENYTVYKTFF